MSAEIAIAQATTAYDIAHVRSLFVEYVEWLAVDLDFQGVDAELETLPGYFAPPRGSMLLARVSGAPAGAVAMRPLVPEVCEMKRMFVREPWRRLELGRMLADRVIADARRAGYRAMRLDTLDRLTTANRLYRSLGFREIPPYYDNPLPGVRYYELDLEGANAPETI